ncbi:MAG: hypothetical protein Q8P57_04355 [Candidatus Pacearchaeota archaeon]|nr:hypothetical protein [Candidatus Pacearchaeota archaeon]
MNLMYFLIFVLFFTGLFIFVNGMRGEVVSGLNDKYIERIEKQNIDFDRTWTKAICSGNVCQDFLIKCFGENFLGMRAISGKVVFSEGWKDLREDNDLC